MKETCQTLHFLQVFRNQNKVISSLYMKYFRYAEIRRETDEWP